MYRPVRTVAPADTPVSLTEVKAHLRVEDTASDTLITGLIAAAVSYLDGWSGILGRCLFTQTWRQDFDDFRSCLRLPLFPVASISSVKYLDTSEVEQTVSASDYRLQNDDLGAFVRFDDDYSFPSLNVNDRPAVYVTYVAGEAAADIPAAIKQGMLLLIGAWFENRENAAIGVSVAALPSSVAADALFAPFRRVRF